MLLAEQEIQLQLTQKCGKGKELILLLMHYDYFPLPPPTMAPRGSHTSGITAFP